MGGASTGGYDIVSTSPLESLAARGARAIAHAVEPGSLTSSAPMPAVVDLVVGGAGPGGLAAAVTAARQGQRVLVLESRDALGGAAPWGMRMRQVMLDEHSMGTVQALGAGHLLPPLRDGSTTVPVGLLEQALAGSAVSAGARVVFDAPVNGVEQLVDGGVRVRTTASAEPIVAGTYVDATGGRSGVPEAFGLGLGPPLPGSKDFFIGRYPTQPHLEFGKHSIPGRTASGTPYRAIVLNHPDGGAHVDVVGLSLKSALDQTHATVMHNMLARDVGIVGAPLEAPIMLRARQHLAPAARVGDVLVIGDGVGRTLPSRGYGAQQSIKDGVAVAEASMLEGAEREAALAEVSQRIWSEHRQLVRDGLWYVDDPTGAYARRSDDELFAIIDDYARRAL